MKKSIYSKKSRILQKALIAARQEAGMTQQEVADSLKRPQSFVAKYEKGDRRLDVIEFLALSEVIKFDPFEILKNVWETD